MQTSEIVKNSEWSRWTPTEEAYLVEHQKESDDDVAAKLGCSSSRVRRKRYALRLLKTEDQKREIRKKARNKQADVWDCQLIVLHSHAASLLAEFGSKEAYKRLKLVIDDIGPQRSISAIQSKCNALGYGESGEHRRQRLESIRTAAAYGKLRCRQIPHTWNWYDLSSLTQTIILFSVLGDASLPKPTSGSHHYYTETKKLAHKPYLLWKRELLPKKFRGNFYEDDPLKKRYPRCTWETGVSQIFTTLRTHLYPKTEGGFKSIISHWVIEQMDTLDELALLGLLI
jgi:hypothetical protein